MRKMSVEDYNCNDLEIKDSNQYGDIHRAGILESETDHFVWSQCLTNPETDEEDFIKYELELSDLPEPMKDPIQTYIQEQSDLE